MVEEKDGFFFKRNDLVFSHNMNGGKALVAKYLIEKYKPIGISSCGSRTSLQLETLSNICETLKIPFVGHLPQGSVSEGLEKCKQNKYTTFITYKAGYNSVLVKRSRDYAEEHNFLCIPLGMTCNETIKALQPEIENIDCSKIKRIVTTVGTGMNYCSIVNTLYYKNIDIPIIGVQVGLDPTKTLNSFLPMGYNPMILKSDLEYSTKVKDHIFCGIDLHPIYEAKCIPFLEKGDLLWIVGR